MTQRGSPSHDPAGGGRPTPARGEVFPAEVFERQEQHTRLQAVIDANRVRDYYFMVKYINVFVPWHEQEMQFKKLYQKLATLHHLTWRSVARDLCNAYLLKTVFTSVYRNLEQGKITLSLAHVFPQYSAGIEDPEVLTEFTRRLLPFALTPGMTPRKLALRARQVAESLHPVAIEDRVGDRFEDLTWGGIRVNDLNDGLVELRIVLNAVAGFAARDRIKKIAAAKHAAQAPDAQPSSETPCQKFTRSALEHLTAAELLTGNLGKEHAAIRGTVNVTVPLLSLEHNHSRQRVEELQQRIGTIAGLSGNAHLAGYGPVPVTHVSQVCGAQQEWYRMFIDPDTGVVTSTDSRRPSAAQRRLLEMRDPWCRWPGCPTPAAICDADHTIPWSSGGKTDENNLELLCRRDHVLKHHAGTSIRQLGKGVLEWTLSDGTVFIDKPITVLPQPPMAESGEGVVLHNKPLDHAMLHDQAPF